MVNHLTVTKARANLGSIIRRGPVKDEYFVLEKNGTPITGMMDADELEDYLDIHDPKTIRDIEASRRDFKAGRFRTLDSFITELKSKRSKKGK